ncbi:conserved membrane hypothetical protein [Gammaproteobacteria bacterium]
MRSQRVWYQSILGGILTVVLGIGLLVFVPELSREPPADYVENEKGMVHEVKAVPVTPTIQPTAPIVASEDYFISLDTVIIGCTAGAAAGILAGSLPLAGAMVTGVGVPASVNLLVNLTGLGCGVGAASGGVAILTAWLLSSSK